MWTFDSHLLWQEPFVIYSQILAATERVIVGPMVTNPGTRDWTVTASLFATLNEMFGNRTVCGIGRGDSALRTLGLPADGPRRAARVASRSSASWPTAARSTYRGQQLQFPWVDRRPRSRCGSPPTARRRSRSTGEVGDGFILQLADPDIAEWMIKAVRAAAEQAGRDPAAIKFCVAAPAYVGDDLAHQRDQTRWFGGMVGNHVADIVARYGDVRRGAARR